MGNAKNVHSLSRVEDGVEGIGWRRIAGICLSSLI